MVSNDVESFFEEKTVLTDGDYLETYECAIECSCLREERAILESKLWDAEVTKKYRIQMNQNLSRISGVDVDLNTPTGKIFDLGIPRELVWQALDATYGIPGALIQPSHKCLTYSLIRHDTDIEKYIPDQTDNLSRILSSTWIRGQEILREFSSENTAKAFKGDLVYWQAWLSAIGYSFEKTPISIDHVKAFIIQHMEGVPIEIDQLLVEQNFKQALGTHKMTTVKRRVASLSIHLQRMKLSNPCHDPEVKKLLEKLTKKYSESKRKGRAITLDVLNAMIETCGDDLIGIRDKALLLFAWGSGGRRRSEVSEADIKDLEASGNINFIYHIPKSKTDQKGEGRTVPVNGRAANALREWLQVSGIIEGKIFRSVAKGGKGIGEKITDVDINRIVKKRCKMAGYDPSQYSAHSLRSGFLTEAGKMGCPLGDAMALSTHRSVNTAMGYYQVGNLENNLAANLV